MRKFTRNWIVRPFTWAIPTAIMAMLLGVPWTWQVSLVAVTASLVSDIVNTLLPEVK